VFRAFGTLTVALVGVFAPGIARAQRVFYSNTNAWFIINADVALNERWGILFDASMRRSGPIDEAMANFVRGGLAYSVTEHVRVAAGANYSKSYPYGEIPAAYAVPEVRFWEQVQLSHSIGKLDVSHRYRVEQRIRGLRSDPDVDDTDVWARSGRFRYQIKGTLPLSGEEVEAGEAYLSASNEIFISYGENVQYNIFDQDRATFVVGYRMNRNWRSGSRVSRARGLQEQRHRCGAEPHAHVRSLVQSCGTQARNGYAGHRVVTFVLGAARYEGAPTFSAYLDSVAKHPELWQGVYRTAVVSVESVERLRRIPGTWRLLALSEDWCGDAVSLLPVLARLTEQAGTDLRVLPRDANADLMDAHLTSGTRSVPVVMVLNDAYEVATWWGPRPAVVQRWYRKRGVHAAQGRAHSPETGVVCSRPGQDCGG
jgi:hypothetical protein